MPHVEFTHSEKGWIVDKQVSGRQMVARAQADAQHALGIALAEIVKSHKLAPPQNGHLLSNEKGEPIGLVWGKEQKEFMEGKFVISGAVVPPQNTIQIPRTAGQNGSSPGAVSKMPKRAKGLKKE